MRDFGDAENTGEEIEYASTAMEEVLDDLDMLWLLAAVGWIVLFEFGQSRLAIEGCGAIRGHHHAQGVFSHLFS